MHTTLFVLLCVLGFIFFPWPLLLGYLGNFVLGTFGAVVGVLLGLSIMDF
jgi:hypothetical protein